MSTPTLLRTQTDRALATLTAAEAAVRAWCGWHIAPSMPETLHVDGSGSETLMLPTLNLESLDYVANDGVELDPAAVEWSRNGFLRLPGSRWSDRPRGVTVQITHGFDAVPDVEEIIREVAARATNSPGGVVREQAGQVSIQYSMTAAGVSGGVVLMAHEREMLAPYKIGA